MAKAKRQPQRPQQRPQGQRSTQQNGANATQRPAQSGASGAAKSARPPQPAGPATPPPSGGGSSRVAGMRARTGGAARQRFEQAPWWRRNLGTLATVGGVVLLVVAFIVFAQIQNRQASVGIGSPAPASVMSPVTGVPKNVTTTVGAGTTLKVFQATPKGTAKLTANGKPVVIYVGADWCPYCAATRWSTVVALSRFGSFKGLTLMRSSPSDVYPNTATFSFHNASYTSQYIVFDATEDADRSGARLDTPGSDAAHALATYDIPPYTTQPGGVPFMTYGNQYVTTSGLYAPSMLQGLDWQQVASQLNNPNSDVTKAIVGGANEQTAAICALTNNQPGSVCDLPVIQQLEGALPQPK